MPDVPRQWKSPAALVAAIAMVVGATIGVVSYVKTLADESADAYFVPLQTDLSQHKASEERWHETQDKRLERIEHKLDQLIDRGR